MKKLLMTALIVVTPTLTLAQEGSGRGECDRYRGPTPDRPDCLGYNPFYNQSGSGAFDVPTASIRRDAVEHRPVRRVR